MCELYENLDEDCRRILASIAALRNPGSAAPKAVRLLRGQLPSLKVCTISKTVPGFFCAVLHPRLISNCSGPYIEPQTHWNENDDKAAQTEIPMQSLSALEQLQFNIGDVFYGCFELNIGRCIALVLSCFLWRVVSFRIQKKTHIYTM